MPILGCSLFVSALVGCATPAPTGPGSAAGISAAPPAPTGLPLKPQVACNLLAEQGLPAAGGYQPTGFGAFVCSSFKKTLPLGDGAPDTLQFLAQGTEDSVTQLRVELEIRSPGDIQAALRMLLAPVVTLTQRVMGETPPEPAQVAIRSGVSGIWPMGGRTLRFERISTFTTSFVASLQ